MLLKIIRTLHFLLISALISSIALPPPTIWAQPTSAPPTSYENLENENPFGLEEQIITVQKKDGSTLRFSLDEENVLGHNALPDAPFDISKTARIAITDGVLGISHGFTTQWFPRLHAQAFVRDADTLFVLSTSGEIWVTSMNRLADFIFRGRVPFFLTATRETHQTDETLTLIKTPDNSPWQTKDLAQHPLPLALEYASLDDSNRPIALDDELVQGKNKLQAIYSGDLAVVSATKNRITQVIPREIILNQFAVQTRLLEFIALTYTGKIEEARILLQADGEKINELLKIPSFQRTLTSQNSISILRNIPPSEGLAVLSKIIDLLKNENRAAYTTTEWQDLSATFEKLKEDKINELEAIRLTEVQKKTGSLLKKSLDCVSLKKVGDAIHWLTHRGNSAVRTAKFVAVASSAGFLYYIIKNSVALSHVTVAGHNYMLFNMASIASQYGFFLASLGAGAVLGIKNNKGMRKALADTLIPIFGTIFGYPALFLYGALAQKNLYQAQVAGLPFLDQLRTANFRWLFASDKKIESDRLALQKIIEKNQALHSASSLMAYALMSESTGIDASVLILEHSRKQEGKPLKLSDTFSDTDRALLKRLTQFYKKKLASFDTETLAHLNSNELLAAWHDARETAIELELLTRNPESKKAIERNESLIKIFTNESSAFRIFNVDNMPFNPVIARKRMRQLHQAKANEFVVNTTLEQYIVDEYSMAPFNNFLGGYANPNQISDLAGRDSPLSAFTHPKLLGYSAWQIYNYLLPGLSNNHLIYGKKIGIENEYAPKIFNVFNPKKPNGFSDQPTHRLQPLDETLDDYTEHASNLDQAQYGEYLLRRVQFSVQGLHTNLLMSLGIKGSAAYLGKLNLSTSTLLTNSLFNIFVGNLFVGTVWVALTRGMQVQQEAMNEQWQDYVSLLIRIDNNLRFEKWNELFSDLHELAMLTPEERMPAGLTRNEWLNELQSLKQAMLEPQQADQKTLKEIMQKQVNLLIEHGKTTPPIYASPHRRLNTLANVIGTLITNITCTLTDYLGYLFPTWLVPSAVIGSTFVHQAILSGLDKSSGRKAISEFPKKSALKIKALIKHCQDSLF